MNKHKVTAEEHFHSYEEYLQFIEALTNPASPVAQFEAAADAIPTGNTLLLAALLRDHPSLTAMRSTRRHHAMLIHYVGANGVEFYRQRTPANAVAILQLLLDAGADVNAVADMYHGSTTLGLVATSVHPSRAGQMEPLLAALLRAGADSESPGAGGNKQRAVVASLHNGRPEAADFLARNGAQLDLESAAGTGKLDTVKTFFNEDGSLAAGATNDQLEMGFLWACAYGHIAVVEFLLQKGVDINKQVDGFYGLHWAIMNYWPEIIKLLISHNASLEVVNVYGGAALGAACWTIANRHSTDVWPERGIDDVYTFELLLNAGAVPPAGMVQWLQNQPSIDTAIKDRLTALMQHI